MAQNKEKAPCICVGAFSSAHGVRGQMKLKSFTDNPEDILRYSPLYNEAGDRVFILKYMGKTGDVLIVAIDGVESRDAAEKLRHQKLYAPLAQLPKIEEDAFYSASLIGLAVRSPQGTTIGIVRAVHDFGAGNIIAVKESNEEENLYAFTRETFPEVNLAEKFLILDKPEEI